VHADHGGLAYVSLAPGARRGHGAAYAAVAAGRIDTSMLRGVLAAARPGCWRPDFAVDTTVWMRSDAECSPQRGYHYHPSRHSAGQPIVAGWSYFARPPAHPGAGRGGAPRRHGTRFAGAAPSSWPAPGAAAGIVDDVYGRVTVAAWHQLPRNRTPTASPAAP
jgi:hypothetical protein